MSDDMQVTENADGSATVEDVKPDDAVSGNDNFYTENLVSKLSPERREEIEMEYIRLIKRDKEAREKHDEQCKKALESTGLTGDAVAAFSGGSTLIHPILAKVSVDFASHAIKEIFPAEGPVRTSILGKMTRKKMDKAERKRRHMNWQLTRQMKEYRSNLEQMLPMLSLCGSQYIRIYWWDRGKRPKSEYISSDKIYLPYHAGSFYSAQRITYEETISDMEYDLRVTSGMYEEVPDEVEIGEGGDPAGRTPDVGDASKSEKMIRRIEGKNPEDEDGEEIRIVYNVYCYMQLEEDDKASGEYTPYIMAINKTTQKMVALYRNWELGDKTLQAMEWIIEWPMIPWGHSVYTIGAGHLVGQLARGASGALRALLDSALANSAVTALKSKSMGLSGQSPPIMLGALNEIRTNAGLDDIRKSVMPMPFNPPSNVLFELLGFLVNSASEVARSTVDQIADQTSNTPVGTQLSRIEQGMVVFSAIHARLHDAQRRTLEVLHRLNRMYLEDTVKPENEAFKIHQEDEPLAYKEDYEGTMDVAPVSDPNIFSEQQRFSQNQMILQLATQFPQIYDIKAVNKRVLSSAKIQGIDELIPDPTAAHDENPAAENIKMAMGQPAMAIPSQDHPAHLQTHIDFWQAQAYGQNPAIQPKLATQMLTHIIQHLIFEYGEMMQQHLKKAVEPDYDGDMSELIADGEAMREMSQAIAAASPIVIQQSTAMFEKALPIIQQLQMIVQKLQPPQPIDPGHAMLQGEQIRAQSDQAKLQQKAQSDMADQKIEEQKIQADLTKTAMDNRTAEEIAAERLVSGHGAGGLKNGESLGA